MNIENNKVILIYVKVVDVIIGELKLCWIVGRVYDL